MVFGFFDSLVLAGFFLGEGFLHVMGGGGGASASVDGFV